MAMYTPRRKPQGSVLPGTSPQTPWWQGPAQPQSKPVQTPGWADAVTPPMPRTKAPMFPPTGGEEPLPMGTMPAPPVLPTGTVQTPGWADAVRQPGPVKSGGFMTFPPLATPPMGTRPAPGFPPQPGGGVDRMVQTPGWGDAVGPGPAKAPMLSSPFANNAFGFAPNPGTAPGGPTGEQAFINSLPPEQAAGVQALMAQGIPFLQAYRMTMQGMR